MKKNLLLIFCVLLSTLGYAQSIQGKITSNTREPIVGATVIIDGTTQAAVTDAMGNFRIDKLQANTKYKLKISLLGYKTIYREVLPSAGSVNFTLQEDTKQMEDVVVVGYGTKVKREVTGSISKIGAKELNDLPVPSFESALQAKLPGVQVTTGSGLAGSAAVIRVRGIASISAGGDPLYVVDGIPITQDYFLNGNSGASNNNPLASINPDDIESIDVLKDAAATAIYGSRGSNGVILITTKRAKKPGVSVSYNGSIGVSTPTALPNMLNTEQYLQLYQEAHENDGGTGLATLPGNISWDDARRTNTDWVDLTTQTGIKHGHNVTVARGGKVASILGNVSYRDDESFLVGNKYKRLSFRLNGDFNITNNLKLGVNTSYSRGHNDRVNNGWSGGLGSAMSTALPIFPVYNADGTFFQGGDNPVRIQELKKWQTVEDRFINGLNMDYRINDEFNVIVRGNLDYMVLTDDQYDPSELINDPLNAGNAYRNQTRVANYNYNVQLNYTKKINAANKITALIGQEYQNSLSTYKNSNATNVTNGFFDNDLSYSDSSNNYREFTPSSQQWAFLSYFGRVGYGYQEKIFLEATLRVDGSSRFGTNNRYGVFPAFAASWILSEEEFLKQIPQISMTKLRVSYGKSGNANIPNYQRLGTFENPGSTPDYNGQPTTFPTRLANPNLRWETSWTVNFGLDMGFYRDRLTFTAEYYDRRTSDVLMDLTIPPSTGFTNYWDNVGSITNKGFEFSMTTRNIDREFKWTTIFNIAQNRNEITSIGVYSENAVSGGTNDTRVVVGQPVGTNYLVRFSHVDPTTGRPVYLDINGNETFTWDPANRVAVGSVLPDAVGGITNNFSYKNWDLGILFNFVLGGDIYESSAKRQNGVVTNWNMRTDLFDRWQQPGDVAAFPRLTLDTETYGSGTPWINTTMWLHDGTFMRLRNVTVGYRVPKPALDKLKIQSARIAFIGTNLLTFTRYPGLDPEIARDFENATDRNMSPNITYLTPPQERSYNLQVSITF
jgi:TonB-linked SusC/RagA family outer membrane protein